MDLRLKVKREDEVKMRRAQEQKEAQEKKRKEEQRKKEVSCDIINSVDISSACSTIILHLL